MAAILAHPEVRPLLSDEHFSVDGTPVKAFATGLEPVTTPLLTVVAFLAGNRGFARSMMQKRCFCGRISSRIVFRFALSYHG